MRLGVFDGQHRFLLMTLFCTGYYEASQISPMKIEKFDSFVLSKSIKYKWEAMQTFNTLRYNIGFPSKECNNMDKVCQELKVYGLAFSEGQELHIPLTFSAICGATFKKLGNVSKSSEFSIITYRNFWKESDLVGENLIKGNNNLVWLCLHEIVKTNPHYSSFLM